MAQQLSVMRRLPALDAWLLDRESHPATGHVGTLVGVAAAAGESWGADRVRAAVEECVPLGALSRRLVTTPLGGRYLVEDAGFDLEFHVRELPLPGPGTTQQLAEQVAAIHARPLDRDRPMWELHVLTGRDDGGAAVYVKVHRTLLEGRAGTGLLQALLPTEVETAPAGGEVPPEETRSPSATDLVRASLQGLASDPRELGYAVPDVLHRLGRTAGRAGLPGARLVAGAAQLAGRLLGPEPLVPARAGLSTPRTRLDVALTPHRRLATGSVPLDQMVHAGRTHGVEVEDLVLVAVAAAVRRWLLDHDALPVVPLVAAVPMPRRSADEAVLITPALVELPTHLREVPDRIAAARESMTAARQQAGVVGDAALTELADTAPVLLPTLAARAMSALALTPGSWANLTVAHTPGPSTPLLLAGTPVTELVPVPALGRSTGGLAVTSYPLGDRLHLGLTACREIVPDLWQVLDYLTEALDEVVRS